MNWAKLTRNAASRKFDELRNNDKFKHGFLATSYSELRQAIVDNLQPFENSDLEAGAYDLEAGLTLYRVLKEKKFEVRQAADESIWRHLSLIVLPDYVRSRWNSGNAEARFWRDRSRIWLRAIWWFIHLSWQGDEDSTHMAIKGMTTDDVVQIVERPGRHGFRVELYRVMIQTASTRPQKDRKIRQLMKLNTATVVMVEPSIYQGGLPKYVEALYKQIDQLT